MVAAIGEAEKGRIPEKVCQSKRMSWLCSRVGIEPHFPFGKGAFAKPTHSNPVAFLGRAT